MSDNLDKLNLFLDKARELGYQTEVISQDMALGRVTKDGKSRFVVGPLVPLNTTVSAKISKDKNLTKKLLSHQGLNTPPGNVFKTVGEIEEAISKSVINFPLVVKPNDAALGTDVQVNIVDMDDLKQSVQKILTKRGEVLVEQFYPWNDYRLFVVDGSLVATARRIPPAVTGDGISTVSELLEKLNLKKLEKKVQIDDELTRTLKHQGLTMDSIIEVSKVVQLRGNANIQTGGFIEELSDQVADKFRDISQQAATTLGMRMAGVDILSPDITSSQSEYVITEVNGLPSYPYIHGHPDIGEPNDPIDKVLEAMFRDIY